MGEFLTLKPEHIIIPEDRTRELDQEHLFNLKNSIAEIGQQTPIVVERKNDKYILVAGLHRLQACKDLGIPVKAIVMQSLSEDEDINKLAVEIAENTARKDLSMEEKQKAIYQFHKLLVEKDPNHTVSRTAKILGLNRSYVSELINAYEQGITGKTFREIRKKRARVKDITKKVIKIVAGSEYLKNEKLVYVRRGDAFDLKDEPDLEHQFAFILTDIPYGISVDETAYIKDYSSFDDSDRWRTKPKVLRVLRLFNYLLRPTDAWAIAFCSIDQWFLAKQILAERDLKLELYKLPLIWHKTKTAPPVQTKYFPAHGYEVAMLLKREGTEVARKGIVDILDEFRLTTDKLHPTEKPVSLGKELVEMFSLGVGKAIDPFAGSGAFAQALVEAGFQTYAVELMEHYYEVMIDRFRGLGYETKEF